ncbi:MAG: AAA family ATPase [Planctomycetaceae bacterium]
MPEPRPLYRLPSVIATDEVWICEGEKAADAATLIGIIATSPTQGSKSPQKTDWSVLNGKRVFILPDNDEPGDTFAANVVALIRKQAPEATIEIKLLKDDWPEIPEKGDVYDWSEQNDSADAETLQERLRALPDRISKYNIPEADTKPEVATHGIEAKPMRWLFQSAKSAAESPKPMRPAIIENLLRRGEVGTIVASPKVGKSWFILLLAMCVSSGQRWLGRTVQKGKVRLIDNELHEDTIENRIHIVARELDQKAHDISDFEFHSGRGQGITIEHLFSLVDVYRPGELSLLILDAKYRFFGDDDENDNAAQTRFHNAIDALAMQLDCGILLVHHSTKGSQASKSVTDIGAGGGAQARAVDLHMVLREHAEPGYAVLENRVRSFAPSEPETLAFDFPVWHLAQSVEPVLKVERSRGDSRQAQNDEQGVSMLTKILHELRTPATRYELQKEFGGSKDRVNRLVRLGLESGRIVKVGTRQSRKGEEVETFTVASRAVDPDGSKDRAE